MYFYTARTRYINRNTKSDKTEKNVCGSYDKELISLLHKIISFFYLQKDKRPNGKIAESGVSPLTKESGQIGKYLKDAPSHQGWGHAAQSQRTIFSSLEPRTFKNLTLVLRR